MDEDIIELRLLEEDVHNLVHRELFPLYKPKVCTKCQEPDKVFYACSRSKDGLEYVCTDCRSKEAKRVREEKKQGIFESKVRLPRLTEEQKAERKKELAAYAKNYREANRERLNRQKLKYANKIKQEGLQIYGNKCSCCGETAQEFLTIEHINGRDKTIKKFTGKKEWMRLRSLGWPTEDITILCYNCNCARGAYGVCPHNLEGD